MLQLHVFFYQELDLLAEALHLLLVARHLLQRDGVRLEVAEVAKALVQVLEGLVQEAKKNCNRQVFFVILLLILPNSAGVGFLFPSNLFEFEPVRRQHALASLHFDRGQQGFDLCVDERLVLDVHIFPKQKFPMNHRFDYLDNHLIAEIQHSKDQLKVVGFGSQLIFEGLEELFFLVMNPFP